MPRIFVARMLPGELSPGSPLDRLDKVAQLDIWPSQIPPTPSELKKSIETADAVVTTIAEQINRDVLEDATRLKIVSQLGVGYDNIDVLACSERGIFVTNTPDVVTDATADLTWALLLSSARKVFEANIAIRESKWGAWHPSWMLGSAVADKTLGIIGPGKIGTAVAERAAGFRMNVFYHGNKEKENFPGKHLSLDSLLEQSDFVSMHIPLNESTQYYCDSGFFSKMKRNAIFINTGRGGLVNQADLISALTNQTIAGAGIDVMDPEPLPANHPLLNLQNCTITPHIGSATLETRLAMSNLVADSIIAAIEGTTPPNLVNP
jgi:glyoxylate reductase